jgi:hypothetical protein
MSICTLPAVLDALRDDLAALPGLAQVQVWTSHPGELTGENILLAAEAVPLEEEPAGLGSTSRFESYTIPCGTWAAVANSTEASIKAARDRVFELYGYVESYMMDAIPQTISSTCRSADITLGEFTQGIYAGSDFNGRWAEVHFTITVEATKIP